MGEITAGYIGKSLVLGASVLLIGLGAAYALSGELSSVPTYGVICTSGGTVYGSLMGKLMSD